MSARRKSKAYKPNTLSIWPPVKTEPLYELDMDIKDVHNQGYGLTEAAVKCLVSVASNVSEVSQEVGFGVVNKPKNLLTEVCLLVSYHCFVCIFLCSAFVLNSG